VTRYLVAGAGGMLGADLMAVLEGRDATGLTHAELDVTDPSATLDAAEGFDVVINTSAYTNVDEAETNEETAHLVNAVGAQNLGTASAAHGAVFLQVSTDYVFDGNATTPYAEDAPMNPASVYGRTKAEGERLALLANPDRTIVVRTAWLYGKHGSNFAKTMLRLAAARDTVDVVADQVGQPTWTMDVARHTIALLDARVTHGTFHATNSGLASWFDFARAIFVSQGLDPDRVHPTDSSTFVRPAPRPAYSVLAHDAWARRGLPDLRSWQDALAAAASAGVLAP
jgi:dTDP-4-dehydrorhamnose reductase